jgi:TPR repeat protein
MAAAFVAPLLCALAVLGGIGSFTTVRHLAQPWFGHLAWIIPVGVDLGILALLAWDLLAEYLGLSWPALRWTAWTFIAATVYLNIAAAHGNPTAAVMHAAMPVLFVTVIEGIRHLIRQITGLATGTRIERVPLSRWLLAPRSTALLARRMVLWHVTSYRNGLALEYEHLAAVSLLQEQHGRWLWRWKAPLSKRLALRLAPAASETSAVATEPKRWMVALPQDSHIPNDRDTRLIETAAELVRDADQRGARLSQAALARLLRARGLSIPNQRLRWLTAAARTKAGVSHVAAPSA